MSSVVPDGWSRHKLGDSLSPRLKSKLPSGESNPLGYYDFYVCSQKVLKSFHNEYSSPSILFSTGGEASVHFATGCYSFSTDVWATEFEGDICNEYAFRLLEENIRTINYSGFQGSGIKHLNKGFIEKLEFSIPPLPEQKKIASILTSVDEVIENTQKQIDKLQDLKKATMNELLTKGIGHTEFKDSELGRIPKSWEVKKVEEVSTRITDGEHQTPKRSERGYFLLSARNIRDGFISTKDVDYVPQDEFEKLSKRISPTEGDVLISCSGSVGRCALVPPNFKFAMVRSVAILQPNRSLIFPDFLKSCIESELVQNQIKKELSQSAQPNLFQANIKRLRITIPSISEQKKICDVLNALQSKIQSHNNKLSQTQSLKKSLMQDLLTGKVRVTVN